MGAAAGGGVKKWVTQEIRRDRIGQLRRRREIKGQEKLGGAREMKDRKRADFQGSRMTEKLNDCEERV